jgi:hypothetical protein
VVAWGPDGIWFVADLAMPDGPPTGPELWGLYHLDPTTGIARHVQPWDTLVYDGDLVGEDVFGVSHDGEGRLLRIGTDGVGHVVPGLRVHSGIDVPAG